MISQKVFDPRHRLVLGGKGRRPEDVARWKVSRAQIRTVQIPLRPLSTRYFYPLLTREQQCNVR